jgi:hypothetical protein
MQGKESVCLYLEPAHIIELIPYPAHYNPEEESVIFFRNIDIRLQQYTLSQPRRL